MNDYPNRQDNEDLKELLAQYENLKAGRSHSFMEEDAFETIIDYFDDNDDLSSAIEAATYAIEQYPYSAGLLIIKADLCIAFKKFKEALYLLKQAAILDNTDTNLYILKIDAYLALDQPEKAAATFDTALEMFQGDTQLELLLELADVYDDYECFDKVFDCMKLVLEIDPLNEEALYKICFWTDFTGRNEEGISLHLKIIEEHPFSELAWFNLAAAYQGIKLYEKSIDAYQYAVAIDEKFDFAYRNMGDAYLRLRKYKEAIEVLQKVLDLAKPEEVIYEAIGHCFDKLQDYPQARLNYRKATQLNQDDSQLYYKIACTYMNEGVWDSAIKNLQTAMRTYRMQPEYNLALGQCYMEQGKISEAVQYFGNVVRTRPKGSNGWIELLRCLYNAKCFEEGAEYVSHAIELTNGKPIFYFYKAAFLLALGHSKEAMLQLEFGMSQNPKLIKKLLELSPSILQHQVVVDIVARHKKNSPSKRRKDRK